MCIRDRVYPPLLPAQQADIHSAVALDYQDYLDYQEVIRLAVIPVCSVCLEHLAYLAVLLVRQVDVYKRQADGV